MDDTRGAFPLRARRGLIALILLTAGCAQGGGPVTAVQAGAEIKPPALPGVPGVDLPELPPVPGIEVPEVPGGLPGAPDGPPPSAPPDASPPTLPGPTPVTPSPEQARPSGGGGPASGTGCGPMTLYALAAGGRPSGVAAGEDGSVWFTDPGTSSIGHLEGDGTVHRYRLLPGRQPGAIARAPDGDLWYTDQSAPRIGRITPAGVVSEWMLPTVEANPMGSPSLGNAPMAIIAGPDGAMWFTESGADQVGRITPDGAIAEFPLPRRERMHAHPTGIAAGPDGGVWFSEPLLGIIARIDVRTHAIREFPISRDSRSGLVGANSLAGGPAGALWYEDPGASAIGRMATDGTVRSIPLANSLWQPWAVSAGPDGQVWFLEMFDGKVIRMTTDGRFTEWAAGEEAAGIGTGSPIQMAAAGDGAMWFAVPAGNRIGRIPCGGADPGP